MPEVQILRKLRTEELVTNARTRLHPRSAGGLSRYLWPPNCACKLLAKEIERLPKAVWSLAEVSHHLKLDYVTAGEKKVWRVSRAANYRTLKLAGGTEMATRTKH